MRVLKIFLTTLSLLLVLGLVAGFIGREIVLSMAVNQVRGAVKELRKLEVPATLTQSCLEYGGIPNGDQPLISIQLRFITSTEYVLEAVCQTTPAVRQIFQTSSLPFLVEKEKAQSGLIEGRNQGVMLTALGRTGVVYEEDSLVYGSLKADSQVSADFAAGPPTVCSGYGFSCCSDVSQVGQGEYQSQALDCPRSCYAACGNRPVVLHFSPDSEFALETRILQLRSGDSAQLAYTVSDVVHDRFAQASAEASFSWSERMTAFLRNLWFSAPADELQLITIAFGDGETMEVSDLQGTVRHTYTCTRALCVYNATIQAVTTTGIASTITEVSKIQVHVQP